MSQLSHVVMVGSALHAPGGITSVVRAYRDSGIFTRWSVIYLTSFREPGLWSQLRTVPAALARFLFLLLSRRVRLLHVHSAARGSFWRKSLFCWMARRFGVAYVFHVHSGEFLQFADRHRSRLVRAWIRGCLERASVVLALTPGWRDRLQVLAPGARIRHLGNPVAVPATLPERNRPARRILFMGRVRQTKGAFDLIRAFAQVRHEVPDAVLVLAGDGELALARDLCAQLGLGPEAVVLTGWVDGDVKARELRDADLFVLPSYFEGLPVGVLEAMAAGLPVVATRVGGIPEVVDAGVSGLLVEPGDLAGLKSALLQALQDTEWRRASAEAAFERVQGYRAPHIVDALECIYRTVGDGTYP